MSRPGIISGVCGLIIAMMCHGTTAEAQWPSGGARMIPGSSCSTWQYGDLPTNKIQYAVCPFLSDSISYWGGSNQSAYVDFYQVHTSAGGELWLAACWESSTGTSSTCAYNPQTGFYYGNQATGAFDYYIPGFAAVVPPAFPGFPTAQEPEDFYTVEIYATRGDTFTVYGISYF
jgi:hypothetical protein